MLPAIRIPAFIFVLLTLAICAMPIAAQVQPQPQIDAPAAPVPPAILAAKRVFISNGGADSGLFPHPFSGTQDRVYNQFYADIKAGGKFELVSAPADADIVVQVTLGTFPLAAGYAEFRLSIFDPKTNVLLWTASEPTD